MGRNRRISGMKYNSPEWLDIQGRELRSIKIPKEYSEYMYALWNLSRGLSFSEGHPPAYWRSLRPKKKIFNWSRIMGLR